MLYLRNNNLLTEQEREAVEATLSQLGLQVREVIVISLPDHLRRPWWRRWLDRIRRPFRRQVLGGAGHPPYFGLSKVWGGDTSLLL